MNYVERVIIGQLGQLGQYGWSDLGEPNDDAWRCERRTATQLRCGCPAWDGTAELLHRQIEIARALGATEVECPQWLLLACALKLDVSVPGVLARRGEHL